MRTRYLQAMHTTNYADTFIGLADDCPAQQGTVPPERGEQPTVALRTYRMIAENPYRFTSDDVIFTVYADRMGIPEAERPAARAAFFAKPQACLRSSDLGRRYGWGIHADSHSRVALYGAETEEYLILAAGRALSDGGEVVVVNRAMRSKRG